MFMYDNKMEYHVIWNIQAVVNSIFPDYKFSSNWPSTCWEIERLKPKVNIQLVTWNKPDVGKFKINIDGSYRDDGMAGIGGIIRDSHGDFIMAFSWKINCTSSNQAEAIAAKFGAQLCKDNGLDNYDMEMDSLWQTCLSMLGFSKV
ncbi:hypothetical protein MTR67_036491 [Solanum verrucosum]|uniref:RNase H type-1 domain-containing protein n=1 Tax=Solanum verrucosum TaxID=315347 RepID=A0AAF0UCM7_SOLVR|nr:hypothetical protein MTR67_036491 [Solanum verrucosum]